MRGSHAARDSERNLAFALLAAGFLGATLLPLNTVFTLLKETPIFWRNIGGYPIELRELVLATYFPLLVANFLLCGGATALLQKRSFLRGRLSFNSLAMVLLFWSVWFLNVGVLLANNIANIIQGRPFHFHPANDWLP
jgi:hypothetical protein